MKKDMKNKLRNKTKEELTKLIVQKNLELMKHEINVRGGIEAGSNKRWAYGKENKFRISEIKKEIAVIKTINGEK